MWELVWLLVGLWAVASVVLPVVTLIKTLSQQRKIDELDAKVYQLQQALSRQHQLLQRVQTAQPTTQLSPQPSEGKASAIQAQVMPPVTQDTPTIWPNDVKTQTVPMVASSSEFTATDIPNQTLTNPHTAPEKPIDKPQDESAMPIVTSLWRSVRHWFLGENFIVRIGALVLLVGVVLLLKLASDYIDIPIAVRMAGVALAGLAVTGIGYRTTAKRRGYGLTLQGVGFAMIYLTVFISFRLYQLLPASLTFGLLAALAGLTVAFSVWQNALPLAVLALGSAFIAPLLVTQPNPSVVMLFSYYLLLNVAVAMIGYYRPWKLLNTLSVATTFGLAYVWGFNTYQASGDWETVRWQLLGLVVAHMALYLFITVRYAQQVIGYNQRTPNKPPLVALDMGLLFGTALLGFGLFASLLNDLPHVLALVSAGLSAVYLGLGFWLLSRKQPITDLLAPRIDSLTTNRYGLLVEAALALGMGFLALVLPLALSAKWSLIGWAVQGAAMVWLGRRTGRRWGVAIGLGLQVLSAWVVNNFDRSQAAWYQLLDSLSIPHQPPTDAGMTLPLVIVWASVTLSAYLLRLGLSPQQTDGQKVAQESLNHSLLPINTFVTQLLSSKWLAYVLVGLAALLYVLSIDAVFGGLHYVLSQVSSEQTMSLAYALLVALALIVGQWAHQRKSWPSLHQLSRWVLPISLYLWFWVWEAWFPVDLSTDLLDDWQYINQLSAVPGLIRAWWMSVPIILIVLVQGAWLLRQWQHESEPKSKPKSKHSYLDQAAWVLVSIVILTAMWQTLPYPPAVIGGEGTTLLLIVPTLIAVFTLIGLAYLKRQPTHSRLVHHLAWLNTPQLLRLTAYVLVPMTALWLLSANYRLSGKIWGMYIPVLNPLDSLLLAILVYIGYLAIVALGDKATLSNNSKDKRIPALRRGLLALAALLAFATLTGMLIRAFAQYLGTHLLVDGGWQDGAVQTGLTILWSLLAMGLMFIASQRAYRTVWFVGVGLLALVVFKLVLIDMSSVGAILRVVSFIGAGLLMLVIGYLAPLPPKSSIEATKNER